MGSTKRILMDVSTVAGDDNVATTERGWPTECLQDARWNRMKNVRFRKLNALLKAIHYRQELLKSLRIRLRREKSANSSQHLLQNYQQQQKRLEGSRREMLQEMKALAHTWGYTIEWIRQPQKG